VCVYDDGDGELFTTDLMTFCFPCFLPSPIAVPESSRGSEGCQNANYGIDKCCISDAREVDR